MIGDVPGESGIHEQTCFKTLVVDRRIPENSVSKHVFMSTLQMDCTLFDMNSH